MQNYINELKQLDPARAVMVTAAPEDPQQRHEFQPIMQGLGTLAQEEYPVTAHIDPNDPNNRSIWKGINGDISRP